MKKNLLFLAVDPYACDRIDSWTLGEEWSTAYGHSLAVYFDCQPKELLAIRNLLNVLGFRSHSSYNTDMQCTVRNKDPFSDRRVRCRQIGDFSLRPSVLKVRARSVDEICKAFESAGKLYGLQCLRQVALADEVQPLLQSKSVRDLYFSNLTAKSVTMVPLNSRYFWYRTKRVKIRQCKPKE